MKKTAFVVLTLLFTIGFVLTGCMDEKSKFIGTWKYSDSGTITFNNDNTVNIDNVGPLVNLELIGVVDFNIANEKITFNSGSIGVTLNYDFPDTDTLILSDGAGLSLTLTKM